jgi:hypothetical protein
LAEILKRSETGMLRAWAADALGAVGTAEDVALLDRVRRSDPDARTVSGPAGPRTIRPVREAAARAVRAIRKRAEAP